LTYLIDTNVISTISAMVAARREVSAAAPRRRAYRGFLV
jgi:hypothetical protein